MSSGRIARVVAILSAAGIVWLWLDLAVRTPTPPGAPAGPLPVEAVPPVLLGVAIFTALAVAGAAAALRRAPVIVVLSGAISLVPVGLFTLSLPWPHRLVGLLDLALVVAGVVMLRSGTGDTERRPGGPTPSP